MQRGLRQIAISCLAVAGAFVAATALPARAQDAPVSDYSEIGRKSCRNDFNKPLSRLGDHQAITYFCKLLPGFELRISYLGANVRTTITRIGQRNVEPQVWSSYDVGERLEWRGHRSAKGFVPEAAILRLRSHAAEGTEKLGSMLAVLRIETDRACLATLIDASVNPRANEEARRAADSLAGSFVCGRDRPAIAGTVTPLVEEALERVR